MVLRQPCSLGTHLSPRDTQGPLLSFTDKNWSLIFPGPITSCHSHLCPPLPTLGVTQEIATLSLSGFQA